MRNLALSSCLAVLIACTPGDGDSTMDTAAGMADSAMEHAGMAHTLTTAELAGTWQMTATPESGSDTSPTQYTLTATSDTTGWMMTFPGRSEPVPLRVVALQGDSIVVEAGPYSSVRRRNAQVTTRTVFRKDGDRIMGMTRARYAGAGADSVVNLRTEGTRAP
jgi:hypothetical protein